MSSLKDPDALYGEGGRTRYSTRAPFATPDNLESAAVYLQSSLKSFGFSGRVNFLSSAPEDISNTFNCVYYLLEKFQKEQGKNEDTSTEVKRLRNELHVGENVYGRLKKDLEMRERDIGTLMIKERQTQSAHQEQLVAVSRDKEVLQKKCNNLSRRQVQFQHEIRRKEVEYQRLQDKLRYYLAEKKREAKASMEIVGRLRQQSQSGGRGGLQLDDDVLKNARGGARGGRSNGKLDENLVKMIVRAYEDKQRDLMMEAKDLRTALNSLQREYAQLLNTRMGDPNAIAQQLRTGVVPVSVTEDPKTTPKASSVQQAGANPKLLNSDTLAGSTSSVTPRGTESDVLARTPSARTCMSAPSSPRDQGDRAAQPPVLPKAEDIAEALKNRKDVEVVPSGNSESPEIAGDDAGSVDENNPQLEITASEKSAPQDSPDEFGVINPSISSLEKDDVGSTEDAESFQENEVVTVPLRTTKPRAFHASIGNDIPDLKAVSQNSPVSPFAGMLTGGNNAKSAKFAWPPPPPTSPPPQSGGPTQSTTPRRVKLGKLGKLPSLSKKPVPNFSKMTDDQLKQELRSRAQEVEEAVLALRAACGSMNPQDMRGVLEKRLHMELVMAANLAEQQEAIINLAMLGMEKTIRSVGSGDFGDSEEERAKLVVYQLERLIQDLNEVMAQIPVEFVSDSLREVLVDLDRKVATAVEEYEAVKEDLVLSNKKVRKLQRSLESSTQVLNDSMTAISKRSAKLAHEQEYLSQLRREFVGMQEDSSSPGAGAPKKGRQTWAEKAQNADPFDDYSEDLDTQSTAGKFPSPRSTDTEGRK